jgi:hypothetical protein
VNRLAKLGPATVVTAVCAVAWLGSLAFRAKVPDWSGGAVADTFMTTIVGYFFTQKGAGK